MPKSTFKNFVCPIDGRPLLQGKNSLRCEKGHIFDVAREGYCNLLLVQQKASLNPGDNKTMVDARRRFLGDGHFAPIADHLGKIVGEIIKKHRGRSLLRIVDVGCGEGYYLYQLSKFATVKNSTTNFELAGCDISKWAVKAAAKRSIEIAWAVAGNRQLPFAPNSVDVILSMFGFPDWKSFKAIQPEDGFVLLVDPGPDHLIELRKIIYPDVKINDVSPLPTECGYKLEQQNRLKFSVDLQNNSSIQDLLSMTPHAFRITQKAREEIGSLKRFTVTTDVVFRVLYIA